MMQTDYGSYLLRNWHHWNIYDPVLTSLSITTVIISRVFLLFHYFRYSFGKSFSGVSEDCLYLNVYAPKVFTLKFVHTVPSLLSLSYNCLFQSSIRMSATILTFELHSKIKFVTLTNALFMIMMTNGKPIFKKNPTITQSDVWTLRYHHLLFGFLKQIGHKRAVTVNILYKHRIATVN